MHQVRIWAVSDPVTARPSICLNMIVKNEVHIVAEVLDVVAPYISSWVIVDTGSDDGTQDLIRNHMARLGIPGELHERPWRNFGHNRTEALTLAQGHADYIWVMDADDTIVGTPDFTRLTADIYSAALLRRQRRLLASRCCSATGRPCAGRASPTSTPCADDPCVVERLDGDYHIEDRHLSTRNLSGEKYARDRDLLLAELERNPEDTRSAFYLAQSLLLSGRFGQRPQVVCAANRAGRLGRGGRLLDVQARAVDGATR